MSLLWLLQRSHVSRRVKIRFCHLGAAFALVWPQRDAHVLLSAADVSSEFT